MKSDVEVFIAMRNERIERERLFFEYWKEGASIAGYYFFGDGTKEGLLNAVSKRDLAPNIDVVRSAMGGLSHGEAVFLVAMYSFYNDFVGAELCVLANVKSIGDLTILDSERRAVIAGLLINYSGW